MNADILTPEARERYARAKEIMLHPEVIEQIGENSWSVPSQTGFGRYEVGIWQGKVNCACVDFQSRLKPCKHIFAVMALFKGAKFEGVAKPKRKTYGQNWSAYDQGQTQEVRLFDRLLRELVQGIEDFPRVEGIRGRKPVPLADQLFVAVQKVYTGMSCRRARGVQETASERGLLAKVPNYAVPSRLMNRPEVTAILHEMVTLSALPLAGLEEGGAISPDSTGIQTTQFGAWREEKHGEKREHSWLKLHAMVGNRTHAILRVRVDTKNSGDCPQFEPLLRQTLEAGFRPSTVPADKGYLSRENYNLAQELGLEAFIPFKVNSRGAAKGSPAWAKAYHLFQAKKEEWEAAYHKRSNVESVFSALKRKFGESIRSRNETAQVNEVLCKVLAYNLTVLVHEMFEHGIAPSFT